jgi:hypothetical protein
VIAPMATVADALYGTLLVPFIAGWLTGQRTMLQLQTDDAHRGRAFGAVGT